MLDEQTMLYYAELSACSSLFYPYNSLFSKIMHIFLQAVIVKLQSAAQRSAMWTYCITSILI